MSRNAALFNLKGARRGRKPSPVRRDVLKITLPPELIERLEAEAIRRFGDAHRPGTSYGKRSETIEQLLEEALSGSTTR